MNTKVFIVLTFLLVSGYWLVAQDFDQIKTDADLAYVNKNYEKALGLYESIMNVSNVDSSDIVLIYSNAGVCCEKLNKNAEAIKYYKEAVKYKVPQLMIYDKLIQLAKDADDNDNYEFALLEKQSEFPEFEIEIKQKLVYLYYTTSQYKKLLETTNALLNWYPEYFKYHLYKGIALQNLNDIKGAEKAYEEALKFNSDDAGANFGKGMILYNRASDMYDKMKKEYESIEKPDRIQYSDYRKNIEKPKAIFNDALPYLLKAYENKAYASMKGIIRNIYLKLEDKENADKYN